MSQKWQAIFINDINHYHIMTTKIILAVSLVAVFAVSLIGLAFADFASWIGATGGDAELKNRNSWTLTATATDIIPKRTSELAGFGWLYDTFDPTDDQIDAFGIVTHNADLNGDGKNDVRDSLQKKEGWHGHNFIFAPGAGDADFCVAEIADAPTSGISIKGNSIKVNLRNSAAAGTFLDDTAVGYAIIVEPACAPTVPTADVVDQEILDGLGLPDGLPLGIVLLP